MRGENQPAKTFCIDVRRCVPAEQTLWCFSVSLFLVRSPGNMKLPLKQKSRNNDLGNECAAQSWDKYPEITQKALRLQLATYQRLAAEGGEEGGKERGVKCTV